MWIAAAVLSALFAGITAILSKCGVKETDSDAATAVRTSVVLVFAWAIVFLTGAQAGIKDVSASAWLFLILSGMATGASWICYLRALSLGEVSRVAAVDKSSTVFSVLLALIFFADERSFWGRKLFFLALIAAGTFLMAEIGKAQTKQRRGWLFFALLSALFASAASLLAKVGIADMSSDLGTAIRTCVVFLMAWGIVLFRKKGSRVKEIGQRDAIFLILSGIATGASWLCYYYAIAYGRVSVVVPVDRLSILVTVFFSVLILREKLSRMAVCGLVLLTAGTVCMAVFT